MSRSTQRHPDKSCPVGRRHCWACQIRIRPALRAKTRKADQDAKEQISQTREVHPETADVS
jgi:hypothetical protein